MEHVDAPWTVQLCGDCDGVGSLSPVSSVDGAGRPAGPPVGPQGGPIHVILKHSHSRGVLLSTHNYGHKRHNITQ